jgi:hypothetical protein
VRGILFYNSGCAVNSGDKWQHRLHLGLSRASEMSAMLSLAPDPPFPQGLSTRAPARKLGLLAFIPPHRSCWEDFLRVVMLAPLNEQRHGPRRQHCDSSPVQ